MNWISGINGTCKDLSGRFTGAADKPAARDKCAPCPIGCQPVKGKPSTPPTPLLPWSLFSFSPGAADTSTFDKVITSVFPPAAEVKADCGMVGDALSGWWTQSGTGGLHVLMPVWMSKVNTPFLSAAKPCNMEMETEVQEPEKNKILFVTYNSAVFEFLLWCFLKIFKRVKHLQTYKVACHHCYFAKTWNTDCSRYWRHAVTPPQWYFWAIVK